jgi:hypothetical protein
MVEASASLRNEAMCGPMLPNLPLQPDPPRSVDGHRGYSGPVRRSTVTFAFVLALLASACAGAGDADGDDAPVTGADRFDQAFAGAPAYPLFVSSEIVVGRNRFLVGLLNEEDAPIGSPEIEMHIDFFDLERSAEEPVFSADPTFAWINEPFQGLYVAEVTFDSAGKWGAEVTVSGDGLEETIPASFEVRDEPFTPALGDPAPAVDTPTGDDVPNLSEISSDDEPEPRFYEYSISGALDRGQPFVVAFATPKFCQTGACAPMWDITKDVAHDYPRLTFIHVEPYDLSKIPDEFEPVEAALEWSLPTEPWVFVVDAEGRVAAKFEGLLDAAELRTALDEVR